MGRHEVHHAEPEGRLQPPLPLRCRRQGTPATHQGTVGGHGRPGLRQEAEARHHRLQRAASPAAQPLCREHQQRQADTPRQRAGRALWQALRHGTATLRQIPGADGAPQHRPDQRCQWQASEPADGHRSLGGLSAAHLRERHHQGCRRHDGPLLQDGEARWLRSAEEISHGGLCLRRSSRPQRGCLVALGQPFVGDIYGPEGLRALHPRQPGIREPRTRLRAGHLPPTRTGGDAGPDAGRGLPAHPALRRYGTSGRARLVIRRLHDHLADAEPSRRIQGGRGRWPRHRLEMVRGDVRRALYGHPREQPRGLCQEQPHRQGQEPEGQVTDHHGLQRCDGGAAALPLVPRCLCEGGYTARFLRLPR